MVASECAPVAKVGGLADVVYGLSRELEIRGNAVEIILPKYDCMRYDQIWGLEQVYDNLWVPFFDRAIHCSVFFGFVHGRKCFFIEPHSEEHLFHRGVYYGHHDDPIRFAFFCRAALEFMFKGNKHPEIIHCHDWQTGLLPSLLFDIYQQLGMNHPRVCYTLHNLRHQGVAGEQVLKEVGLGPPEYYFHPDRLLDHGNPSALNFMKGGIVYSNFVTTVSPSYAWEIQTSDLGCGLNSTLHAHAEKFGGILNGIDYDIWNPEIDPYIAAHYSVDYIEDKFKNKETLRNRLLMRQDFKPLICYIGRLDDQKGVHLIRHSIFYALNHGCQFALLGSSPDRTINEDFWHLKHHLNDNPDCHLEIGYDEDLAHLLYAGSDMIIVPSLYEPCGLTQMIAMRYGTVPIVRETGGLKDTVFDAINSEKPYEERNGYVFRDASEAGIEYAMDQAIGLWGDYPQFFRQLMCNGMRYDYSWNHTAQHYLNVYNHIKA